MAWWWSGSSRREANSVGEAKMASIMWSIPVRVIGWTVFERYQKRCVRKTVGSILQGEIAREVVVSVAIAVSCEISKACCIIMLGQKGLGTCDHF